MILNSQNKLQSDLQFVLIDIDDKDSMSLIRSVDQNLIFIDAVSKRTNWIRSNLDQLGLKAGCYLISDLRDQTNVDIVSLINAFSPIRQYGYQVGIIADINQLPSLDELIKNQVYLINSGKSNQKQDALLQNNEIDDCSGKLSKGMSVAWQRDYTNVDISIDRAGYVGMGQDTLLKGGKGFGYSTNGKDFNTVISPKGIIFRRADAERMWRLLRPKEINDIDMTVNDRVKKMVDSATAEIPQAVSNANEAVKKADSAVANSKVNSDAIKAMQSAASEAVAGANEALANAQTAINNVASLGDKVNTNEANISATQKQIEAKADQVTVDNLNKTVSSQVGEIQANANGLLLKADKTVTDILNKSVQEQQVQQKILADQIKTKVTSSDVKGILADGKYATQDYTQTLVNQTSRTLSASITEVQRNADSNHQADVNRMTNLQASIDGLQSTIRNNSDSVQNQITQLANVTKSEIKTAIDNNTPAKSIGGAVDLDKMMENGKYLLTGPLTHSPYSDKESTPDQVYLLVSDLGQDQTVYSDTDKKYYSRSAYLVQTATDPMPTYEYRWHDWREGAESTQITQMKNAINLRAQQGDLISQINLAAGQTLIQSDKIYLDAGTVAFSGKAFIPSAAIASLEADKITTGTLNGVHIRQIANANGRSIDIANGNISLNSSDPYEPRITFNYQGKETKMFNAVGDLEADSFSIFNFSPYDTISLHPIKYFDVTNTGGRGSGNASMHLDHAIINGHEWWASADGITFGRSYDGQNASSTYVDLYAKSFDPHSQLSSKTRIERLDGREALATIMNDDMYTYQYKSDVASGSTKRYASLIIDDVNDVKQYRSPKMFIADNGKCRDDGTQLAYLIAAFQYQHQVINELTDKVNQLEEKING